MKTIKVADAAKTLKIDDNVQLIYPASGDGAPQTRVGRIEKIIPSGVVVEIPQNKGFRTFSYNRIIGDITIT